MIRLSFAFLALTATHAFAQQSHLEILKRNFSSELTRIAEAAPGVLGVAIIDLTTGDRWGVNESLVFPQGSAIKIAILLELYRQAERGTLRLDERVSVHAQDQVGGSGVLQRFSDGTSALSLHDLAVLMIVLSDNTATNILIDKVGMASVNRTMQETAPSIVLRRKMIRPRESAAGNENVASPADAASLMRLIARCELPLSRPRCAELRGILEIPKSGPLPASVPSGVSVAWKPGSIEGVSTAWGIVELPGRPYVIAAMVNYSVEDAATGTIRKVADAAYAYFFRLAGATPYGTRVAPLNPR